jgi:hypothetical protein
MQNLHAQVLQFSKAYRSLETQRKSEESMHELSFAAEEDGSAHVPPHYQIKSLHERVLDKKAVLQLPPRTGLSHIIMKPTKYLDSLDPEREMIQHDAKYSDEVLVSMAYNSMMDNPAHSEAHNPEPTLEDMVGLLHENA